LRELYEIHPPHQRPVCQYKGTATEPAEKSEIDPLRT
jgi:hypothetical protein